jgi:predicted HD superfamily hydrolase involved in NAD metabolism
LPKGLREHIERGREVGKDLAVLHGTDTDRVDLGIAAHDLARSLDRETLLEQALSSGLTPDTVERHEPVLLHGPLAAAWLVADGLTDNLVLDAVRWHSTGKVGMGTVAKVVFLADKLDPEKVRRYPALEEVRDLAQKDLDRAIIKYLNHEIGYLVVKGRTVHPASIELRNELLLAHAGTGFGLT